MNDFQSGYDGLARPGNGNWTAFNNGIAQRQHEQFMADMSARNHAAAMGASSSAIGPVPFSGGGYAPMDGAAAARVGKVLLGICGLIALIAALVAAFNEIEDRRRAAARAERAAEQSALQQSADAEWEPRLRRALADYNPARDLPVLDEAARISSCHAERFEVILSGGTTMLHCAGAVSGRPGASASFHFDRIVVEHATPNPTTRHRLTIMPLTRTTLRAGASLGREAPVTVATSQFGAEQVAAHADRACIVIEARRIASNLDFNGGDPQLRRGTAASYASLSAVSVACRGAAGNYRVVASRRFRT